MMIERIHAENAVKFVYLVPYLASSQQGCCGYANSHGDSRGYKHGH